MLNRISFFLLFLTVSIISNAQDLEKEKRLANQEMRDGNALYQKNSYADAEVAYKKSVATYPGNPKAIYNLANSMAQQERYKEALKQYDYLAKSSKSNKMRAQSYHNMGNAFMGLKKLQKAIDSYKNALRVNPKDEETRYNLAYAQDLLKQQQQQNKDDKNKDNKDKNKKDKDKKDDKNKDNKDKDKKGKDKKDDKKEDEDKKKKDDKKDGDKDKKEGDKKDKPKDQNKDKEGDDKQKPKPRPGKLTPQQAEQLLKALQNEEKKTQDKVNAKRVKGKPIKTEKDW
ncbi:MAG TPA: tetratricopeptide repeat protein [Lutibacter sp.]|nr:tetratricopeptide repeat protein [Lutibacter sp.]